MTQSKMLQYIVRKKTLMAIFIICNLKKEINQNDFQITYAKKGIFREFNNMPVLVLYNGATITGKNDKITNFSFSKSDFPLNNFKTNTTTYKKTQELSSFELFLMFAFFKKFQKKIKRILY